MLCLVTWTFLSIVSGDRPSSLTNKPKAIHDVWFVLFPCRKQRMNDCRLGFRWKDRIFVMYYNTRLNATELINCGWAYYYQGGLESICNMPGFVVDLHLLYVLCHLGQEIQDWWSIWSPHTWQGVHCILNNCNKNWNTTLWEVLFNDMSHIHRRLTCRALCETL